MICIVEHDGRDDCGMHQDFPFTWKNLRSGVVKLKIKELGSRYLFICLYVWQEKYFPCGDYKKK